MKPPAIHPDYPNLVKKVASTFLQASVHPSYLKLIRDYGLVRRGSDQKIIDPFNINLDQKIEKYYFARNLVEDFVYLDQELPENQIITGRYSSGKTTILLRTVEHYVKKEYLPVFISLHDTVDFLTDEQFLEKSALSPLSIPIVSRIIFNQFWNQFILQPNLDPIFTTWFRKFRTWMENLRRFYTCFPPLQPIEVDDFELMTWLTSDQANVKAEQVKPDLSGLNRLLKFVTGRVKDNLTGQEKAPYKKVILLIDGTEILHETSALRLLQDFEQLTRYRFPELKLKLVIDESFKALLDKLDLVQNGQVFFYEMPKWTKTDLDTLLFFRPLEQEEHIELYKWYSPLKETPAGISPINPNEFWTLLFRPWEVWRKVPDILTTQALRTYQEHDVFDAPYHLLRLTRGILSVYAGCYPDLTPDQFSVQLVEDLCSAYWAVRKEGI